MTVRLKSVLRDLKLINELSKKELKSKYYGSILGLLWAFIQPVIMISILWFVFQVGFRSVPVDNIPFILWLVAGMVPWLFVSDVLSNGVSAVTENSFLVKKVVFKTELLPLVRTFTAFKIHLIFVGIMFLIYVIYDFPLTIYNLQILYYIICAAIFSVGITYITASLNVFLKDIGQIVAMLTQFGFWITPIFWTLKMLPEKYHFIVKLNPVFYIVEGYRKSLYTHELIIDYPNLTIYFWCASLVLLGVGLFLFKKLKPHFADVL